jgi:hypothetical protein
MRVLGVARGRPRETHSAAAIAAPAEHHAERVPGDAVDGSTLTASRSSRVASAGRPRSRYNSPSFTRISASSGAVAATRS